jgi:hypothetical protein
VSVQVTERDWELARNTQRSAAALARSFAKARAEGAAEAAQRGPDDDYWDNHARHCGNCGLELLVRNGDCADKTGLSDPGDSEDEALCGGCAGAQMYIYMETVAEYQGQQGEFEARAAEAAQRIAELEAELRRIATDDWGADGGRVVKGNAELSGAAGEFYKAMNAGIDAQFAKTRKIAEAALAQKWQAS